MKTHYELTSLECDLLNLLIDVQILNVEAVEADVAIDEVSLDIIFEQVRARLDKEFAYHPLTRDAINEKNYVNPPKLA